MSSNLAWHSYVITPMKRQDKTKTNTRKKVTKQQLFKQNMFCSIVHVFLFFGELWGKRSLHKNIPLSTVNVVAVKTQ